MPVLMTTNTTAPGLLWRTVRTAPCRTASVHAAAGYCTYVRNALR
jgi:hypothetical protein